MSAKRDEHGNLLCKRPGCDRVRTSNRECAEHAAMSYATWLDGAQRKGLSSAPWWKRNRP